MKIYILSAMGFYVFYMWALAILNFRARVAAIKGGEIRMSYFRAYNLPEVPEKVIVRGRHFDNQFQAPMVFFVTCLTYLVIGIESPLAAAFAWVFVTTRVLHTMIHLGSNNVRIRAIVYAAGWIIMLIMWLHILYSAAIQ